MFSGLEGTALWPRGETVLFILHFHRPYLAFIGAVGIIWSRSSAGVSWQTSAGFIEAEPSYTAVEARKIIITP